MPVYNAPTESITVSNIAYVPYSGSISGTPLQLARDFLSDWYGDYLFFRFSDVDYVLILPDSSAQVTVTDSSYVVDGNFSVFEIEQVSGVTGYSGTTYSTLYYTPSISSLTILNSNHLLMYSNAEGYAKLQEGGVYFEYAQTCILCGAIVFCLLGRIFKRVLPAS